MPLRHLGSQRCPRIKHVFGNVLRHHCLRCGHDLNVISFIRNSSVPFPERLELPSSSDAILSGYEDLVSSGSDHFTMWGKMSPYGIFAEHVVDIHKVVADFRDAFERNQSSSTQTYGVNKYFSSQSPVQRRLSIYNWNPGPRRGKEDALEKWHIVTLQEASDYVDHDILQDRCHVTHYAGCAILFNKDTFYPDISVKSVYLHDTRRDLQDQVVEGEQGWVLQGVLSRFLRVARMFVFFASRPHELLMWPGIASLSLCVATLHCSPSASMSCCFNPPC